MGRLTERSKNTSMVWFKDNENSNMLLEPCEMSSHHSRMAIAKLAAYEDAEEQGLLIRLPCKVGDTIYKVDRVSNKIKQHKVVKFEVGRAVDQVDFENFDYCFLHHFGKTVFLTKSEAEAKLKEMI